MLALWSYKTVYIHSELMLADTTQDLNEIVLIHRSNFYLYSYTANALIQRNANDIITSLRLNNFVIIALYVS